MIELIHQFQISHPAKNAFPKVLVAMGQSGGNAAILKSDSDSARENKLLYGDKVRET